MNYIPISNLEQWRSLLADPNKQWVYGYSAYELAHAWQGEMKFPASIEQLLLDSGISMMRELDPIAMFPEHQVHLDTRQAPSQNDLFVLARTSTDLMTIMVEGKVDEPFGPTVADWLKDASAGKLRRLQFLKEHLHLSSIDDERLGSIRYQLLHRTASALIEAKRYHARHAMMLVHSFSDSAAWLEDYDAFLALYDLQGGANAIAGPVRVKGIDLWLGWISDRQASDFEVFS
ncbi:DUF6946 family protein [Paenibacillus chungangensis]|uniref:DUF6946 family protein n=1 Tax=Paenibacillus chungangensis TaxID=696535 RepID=A0ABW3HT78_9BACL